MKIIKKILVSLLIALVLIQFYRPEKNDAEYRDISVFLADTKPNKEVNAILENKTPPVFTNAVGTDITDCGVADGTITITANSPIGNAIQYSIDAGANWQSSNIFVNSSKRSILFILRIPP